MSALESYRQNKNYPASNTYENFIHSLPKSCSLSEETLRRLYKIIDHERDIIYTEAGIKLFEKRYLCQNNDDLIQFCLMRAAIRMSNNKFTCIRAFYEALSAGYMHISTVMANESVTDSSVVPTNTSCAMMVAESQNSSKLLDQLSHILKLTNNGVGLGLGVENLLLNGSTQYGGVRSGFRMIMNYLDTASAITKMPRRSNVTIYVHLHQDLVVSALELKQPGFERLDNIFTALMIPDHFMECIKNRASWYFFPSDVSLNGKTLNDCSIEEYAELYNEMVENKLYTSRMSAIEVMSMIIKSLCHYGSPYIVWSDTLNRYNNLNHLGKIKTLNLCSEISNYSSTTHTSTCTLMSVNCAAFKLYPKSFAFIRNYIDTLYDIPVLDLDECLSDELQDFGVYMYYIGHLATIGLNNILRDREYREIGVTPLGLHDALLMLGKRNDEGTWIPSDLRETASVMAECLYLGAIQASCDYYNATGIKCANFDGSQFSKGRPQWVLRDHQTLYSHNWDSLRELMVNGMSNSMLTCQAPTASTSLFLGVTASVTLQPSMFVVMENNVNRSRALMFGLRQLPSSDRADSFNMTIGDKTELRSKQLLIYRVTAPFIDHSQSTMYTLRLDDTDAIFDVILDSYVSKLKVGLYYLLPLNTAKSLQIVDCSACTM